MKFRKKPVVIDAEQFDPYIEKWPEGVKKDSQSPTGTASSPWRTPWPSMR